MQISLFAVGNRACRNCNLASFFIWKFKLKDCACMDDMHVSSWLAMHKSLKLRIINCISLKKIYMDICERFYTVRSIDKEIYLNILCVIFLV
jgi:hypothetical protein